MSHTPEAQPLHTAEEMPTVLRQMAKYDPMREAVLTEAADHIDGLLAGRASMVTTATALLVALVDPDPCEWDHNHSCQAHGHFYIPQGEKCPVQEAKDFIARPDCEEQQ